MSSSFKNMIRLFVFVLTLASLANLVSPSFAHAGAPPEINKQLGKKAYDKYVNGENGNKPWLKPKTVGTTCEAKLNELNAYGRCHTECGPTHARGALDGINVCMNSCLARFCNITK